MLTNREWGILFISTFITFVSFTGIAAKVRPYGDSFLYFALTILVIDYVVYYLINEIMEREIERKEDEVFRERVKYETVMYQSISENLDRQRKRTYHHDYEVYMEQHPGTAVVQMDSVIGGKGGKVLFPVILTDNGSEFSNPKCIENGPDGKGFQRTRIYYCNPSAPCQKAEIEVGHEFIRRVVPKGKSFDELTQADIDRMMDHVNSYRRKKLNGKSPYEAFCFYYGEELAQKLGCHEVDAATINLTPGLLRK